MFESKVLLLFLCAFGLMGGSVALGLLLQRICGPKAKPPRTVDIVNSVLFFFFVVVGILAAHAATYIVTVENEIRAVNAMTEEAFERIGIDKDLGFDDRADFVSMQTGALQGYKAHIATSYGYGIFEASQVGAASINDTVWLGGVRESILTISIANLGLVATYAFLVWASVQAWAAIVNWSGKTGASSMDPGSPAMRAMFNMTRRKWADSIYFYGFILTLIALVFALGFSDPGSRVSEGALIESTLVQNAFALVSTVAALVFRLLWSQTILEETSAEVEIDMMIRKQTDGIEHALGILRDQTNQMAGIIEATSARLHTAFEKIPGNAGVAAEELERFGNRLGQIEIDEEAVSQAVAAVFESALEDVRGRIESLGSTLESGTDAVSTGMSDFAAKARDVDMSSTLIEAFAKSMEPFKDRMNDGGREAAQTLRTSLTGVSEAASEFTNSLSSIGGNLGSVGEAGVSAAEGIATLRREFDEFVTRAESTIQSFKTAGMTERANSAARDLADIKERLEEVLTIARGNPEAEVPIDGAPGARGIRGWLPWNWGTRQ
jgi:archaellum component FlaC